MRLIILFKSWWAYHPTRKNSLASAADVTVRGGASTKRPIAAGQKSVNFSTTLSPYKRVSGDLLDGCVAIFLHAFVLIVFYQQLK